MSAKRFLQANKTVNNIPSRESDLWLFVGLGNPGKAYEGHRHNLGFWAIDALAATYSKAPWQEKPNYHLVKATIPASATAQTSGGTSQPGSTQPPHSVWLIKPMTYMNRCGPPVAELARYYRVPLHRVIVFYDDLALACGKIKIKWGGGNAGHNGLKSLDAFMGKNYGRVRLGIDHPGDKDQVSHYVLSNFSAPHKTLWQEKLHALTQHIGLLLDDAANNITAETGGALLTALARDLAS